MHSVKGTIEDGAIEDGAIEDGAIEDGAICYGETACYKITSDCC